MKFVKTVNVVLFVFLLHSIAYSQNFKEQQLKNPRVKTAYTQKEQEVKRLLDSVQVNSKSVNIFIRVFKKEELVELWVKNKDINTYTFLKSFKMCRKPAPLGPKRKEKDDFLPEGFYLIEKFIPDSRYYVSLMLNYPNESDKILGSKVNPGENMAIHGSCQSIGCFPIGDENIKELYIFAVEARNNGQKQIPVHVFPARLNEIGMEALKKKYADEKKLIKFWQNLREGYNLFENNKIVPTVKVDKDGKFLFE